MNDDKDKVYTTLDSYQAGYLLLKGHSPKLVNHRNKIVFSFSATEGLYQNLSDYNNGDLIEALKLVTAIKELKSKIFSLKNQGCETKGLADVPARGH
jgi:hypothetical protein